MLIKAKYMLKFHMNIQTLRLNRSTIEMNIMFDVICVIETKIDESFSERYEPVSLNMYVM